MTTEDVEFTIQIEDYRSDRQSVYPDWRDDPRFDALTDLMIALFPDNPVNTSGRLIRYVEDGNLIERTE